MNRAIASGILGTLFLLSAATFAPAGASEPIKAVFVKDGQIYYKYDLEAPDIQLTHEDTVKFMPVWSWDGLQIAFVEQPVGGELGRLVVIDERGKRLKEVELGGEDAGAGMRFVEALEWVSPRKLALSGSVNPSLTETQLIDLEEPHGEHTNIFDDGVGTDFAPGGAHFAYTSGSPHFTQEQFRAPALYVDFERVFPEVGVQVRFVSERAWSSEGDALAVVAEEVSTGKLTLVVWRASRKLERRSLPVRANEIHALVWSSGMVFVKTKDGLMSLLEGGQVERSEGRQVGLEAEREAELRQALLNRIEGHARTSIDFWCADCPLSASRRRVTLAH